MYIFPFHATDTITINDRIVLSDCFSRFREECMGIGFTVIRAMFFLFFFFNQFTPCTYTQVDFLFCGKCAPNVSTTSAFLDRTLQNNFSSYCYLGNCLYFPLIKANSRMYAVVPVFHEMLSHSEKYFIVHVLGFFLPTY